VWKRYWGRLWSGVSCWNPTVRMMVMRFKNSKSDEEKDFWWKVAYEKDEMGMGMMLR
jgi:hypothetical protein